MLVVTHKQFRAMDRVSDLKAFQNVMVDHIAGHFFIHTKLLGRPGLEKVIETGVEKGRHYGYHTRYELCLFIDMMIMLGSGFDDDVQLPFIKPMLNNKSIYPKITKIDAIYDRAMGYIETVSAPDEVFPVKALMIMMNFDLAAFEERLRENPESALARELKRLWPEKYGVLGEPAVAQLLDLGKSRAGKYGFSKPVQWGYFTIWMFLLGHRFDQDLIYPWFGAALSYEEISLPDERFSGFEFTMKAILAEAF